MELKKAFQNPYFYVSLCIMCTITVCAAAVACNGFYSLASIADTYYFADGKMIDNEFFPLISSYYYWIGGESQTLMSVLFRYLLPVAAVLPYGWSFLTERKSGYIKTAIHRTGRFHYFFSKSLAVFTAGFCVILVPLVLNFLIVSAVFPSSPPQINYVFYNNSFGVLWMDLFYTQPMLYVGLYILLNAVFAGLFALLASAIGFFIRNRFFVIFFPFTVCLALQFLTEFLRANSDDLRDLTVSPLSFLHPDSVGGNTVWWVVLTAGAVFSVIPVLIICIKGRKNEIF